MDRRKFLMTGVVVASAPIIAKASSSKTNHIKPVELDNEPMIPARHVTPPGTKSRADFMDHCTGCGLCISHCTSHVLRPSTDQYGYRHALKPVMVFSDSWCYYNCTRCTTVCPTGALNPLTRKEKHNFTNGLAQVELSNCQSATGSHCGACSRRCPNDAISMKAINGNNGMCPVVDASRCTGCGACEYICPASPVKAIVINGNH
jgi:ferredoxin